MSELSARGETRAAPIRGAATPQRREARRLRNILSLDDFERVARRHLPRMIYGYTSGAVERGAAFRAAAAAYDDYAFVPRTLVDISRRQQERALFGRVYAAPFGVAPLGGAAIAAYRGDIALAEAAARANLPMILSATSLIPLEEVRRHHPAAWFQAYLAGDPERIDPMVERVGTAGFETLVVTVDTPVPGNRENNLRNGYSMPIRVTPRMALDCALHPFWLFGTLARTFVNHGMPHFENMDATRGPPMLSRNLTRNFGQRDQFSWTHLERIRRLWPGRLVVKGLLALDDVRQARQTGADGIVLSSHGGRQLDHAVAPLHVLPQAVKHAEGMAIMIDGGVRRGTDVLKALALGADFVFLGRPFIHAAAIAGAEGVGHAMRILTEEIDRDMALLGLNTLEEIGPDYLAHRAPALGTARQEEVS